MNYTGSIDFSSPVGPEKLLIRAQDENAHSLSYTLYNEGEPFDLTDKSVTLYAQRAGDKAVFFLPCTVEGSVASVTLTGGITAKSDVLRCEFCVIGENFAITSPSFNLHVKSIVRDDDAIESSTQFTALEQLMQTALKLPDPDIVNPAVDRMLDLLSQMTANGIADGTIDIPKTTFFAYLTSNSENLFNLSTAVPNQVLLFESGAVRNDELYTTSTVIPIESQGRYFFGRTDQPYWDNDVTVCWYNDYMELLHSDIISSGSVYDRALSTPVGAGYVRFCAQTSEMNTSAGVMVSILKDSETVDSSYLPEFVEYNKVAWVEICDKLLQEMFDNMHSETLLSAKEYTDDQIALCESGGTTTIDQLDDVPSYSSADKGKSLTVQNNGTLGWKDNTGAVIDDTAGNGDTNKTWSADKLHDEFADYLKEVAFSDLTDAPSYSSADKGKALTVQNNGTLGWKDNTGAVIDDTAGDGDTNKTWSANKLHDEFADCLREVAFSDLTDAPSYSSADSGKSLTVQSNGSLGWSKADSTPVNIIDDTAGDGDTDKTWSADKLTDEFADRLTSVAFSDLTDAPDYSVLERGKSLTVQNDGTLGWEQLQVSSSVDGGVFVVSINLPLDAPNTADKTPTEIYEAFIDGKTIIARLDNGVILHPLFIESTWSSFVATKPMSSVILYVAIDAQDGVLYEEHLLPSTEFASYGQVLTASPDDGFTGFTWANIEALIDIEEIAEQAAALIDTSLSTAIGSGVLE